MGRTKRPPVAQDECLLSPPFTLQTTEPANRPPVQLTTNKAAAAPSFNDQWRANFYNSNAPIDQQIELSAGYQEDLLTEQEGLQIVRDINGHRSAFQPFPPEAPIENLDRSKRMRLLRKAKLISDEDEDYVDGVLLGVAGPDDTQEAGVSTELLDPTSSTDTNTLPAVQQVRGGDATVSRTDVALYLRDFHGIEGGAQERDFQFTHDRLRALEDTSRQVSTPSSSSPANSTHAVEKVRTSADAEPTLQQFLKIDEETFPGHCTSWSGRLEYNGADKTLSAVRIAVRETESAYFKPESHNTIVPSALLRDNERPASESVHGQDQRRPVKTEHDIDAYVRSLDSKWRKHNEREHRNTDFVDLAKFKPKGGSKVKSRRGMRFQRQKSRSKRLRTNAPSTELSAGGLPLVGSGLRHVQNISSMEDALPIDRKRKLTDTLLEVSVMQSSAKRTRKEEGPTRGESNTRESLRESNLNKSIRAEKSPAGGFKLIWQIQNDAEQSGTGDDAGITSDAVAGAESAPVADTGDARSSAAEAAVVADEEHATSDRPEHEDIVQGAQQDSPSSASRNDIDGLSGPYWTSVLPLKRTRRQNGHRLARIS